MKALVWLVAAATLGGLALPARQSHPARTLVISGNYQGKLTPCGCTRPMSGGLRRLSTLVANSPDALWIDTGGWVTGTSQQEQMKAETVAETLGQVGVSAPVLTASETAWGDEMASNLESAPNTNWLTPHRPREIEGVWIGTGDGSATEQSAIDQWMAGQNQGRATVWVTPRSLERALELKGPQVIVYASETSPETSPRRQGGTWYITPGSKGKMAVTLRLDSSGASSYRRVELTEEFPDEPRAARVFATYLDRVSTARLIEKLPRRPTEAYTGNTKCGSCHSAALASWKASAHSHALSTLEKLKEDRDPDCLPCHVVGLESVQGFRDRKTTPKLADVGCESCHGPLAAHSADPYHTRAPRVQLQVCRSCHNADNSPNFDPQRAWNRISHGVVDKSLNRSE